MFSKCPHPMKSSYIQSIIRATSNMFHNHQNYNSLSHIIFHPVKTSAFLTNPLLVGVFVFLVLVKESGNSTVFEILFFSLFFFSPLRYNPITIYQVQMWPVIGLNQMTSLILGPPASWSTCDEERTVFISKLCKIPLHIFSPVLFPPCVASSLMTNPREKDIGSKNIFSKKYQLDSVNIKSFVT